MSNSPRLGRSKTPCRRCSRTVIYTNSVSLPIVWFPQNEKRDFWKGGDSMIFEKNEIYGGDMTVQGTCLASVCEKACNGATGNAISTVTKGSSGS